MTGDSRWSGVENRGGLVDCGLIDHSRGNSASFHNNTRNDGDFVSWVWFCCQRHRALGSLYIRLARWPVDGGNRCRILWNKPTAKRSLAVFKNQLRFVARR